MNKLTLHNLSTEKEIEIYRQNIDKISINNPFYKVELLNFNLNKLHSLHYFIFEVNDTPKALMPIYIRQIKINGKITPYFDVISPYGYSGPLYIKDINDNQIREFWKAVDIWYKQNNIISEFIRFSLTGNHKYYSGSIIHSLNNVRGKIIPEEEQWNNFRPKVRNNYRKAQLNELKIQIAYKTITENCVNEFYRIYIGTMKRANADKNYFYSLETFKNFIFNNPDHCALVMVRKDGILISVELILLSETTIYSFLGGTESDYFKLRPNDFLKNEVLNWGRKMGLKEYILGGGRKDNDSLYDYKKSFFNKDEDIIYYTGRKILNYEVYNTLVNNKNTTTKMPPITENDNLEEGFFPKYRDESLTNKDKSVQLITDKENWQAILSSVDNYDFYHTYDYHKMTVNSDEKFVLFTYKEEQILIAIPLLIRPIKGTKYFDATSVYGYVGPLQKGITSAYDNTNFRSALNNYLNKEKIISVFSRLNPYMNNQLSILNDLGVLENIGNVVNIDLTNDIATQRIQYSKSTKSRVNKIRKECYVRLAKNEDDINEFIDIYYENMNRLDASDSYFFNKEYFHNFYKSTDFETDILMVFDNQTETPIAASMFVKTNNIIQFHLSGTRDGFLHIAPARLFIDEMRLRGTKEGFSFFNLGGGLGGYEDSLFKFKSSFSNDYKQFYVWKYIVNEKIYNKLSESNEKLNFENVSTINFFPLYRY